MREDDKSPAIEIGQPWSAILQRSYPVAATFLSRFQRYRHYVHKVELAREQKTRDAV
jgi:hypothetical protein